MPLHTWRTLMPRTASFAADGMRSVFVELALRQPTAEALLAPGRRSLCFGEVPDCLDAVRQALEAAGVGNDDLVATALPDGADTAACVLALECCSTAVPLNPALSESEFERYLRRIRPKAVILPATDGANVRRVADALEIPVIDFVVNTGAAIGAFTLQSGRSGPPAHLDWNRPDEIGLILLTSGSTGRAKLVPVPTGVLLNYASAMRKYYGIGPADRSVHVMPMFHGHGLMSSLAVPLLLGASVVCPSVFDVEVFFSCLETFRATWYSAGFAMHRAILDGIDPYRAHAKNARLRFIRSGSGRLEPQLMLGLEDAFGAPVLERYGMSETCTLTYNPPPPAVRKPGTVGIVGVNSVRIVGPDGSVCGPNQEGEIVASGPTVVDSYWDDPETTAAAFVDGWFHTGDLGRFDDDGYLTITGRLNDLINRGGEKISPVEIEGELLRHPDVLDACVFPVPHPTLGQEVVAALVPRAAGTLSEPDVLAHARSRLAAFKVPRRLYVVAAIPRSPAGKVRRSQLPHLLGLLDNTQVEVADPPHAGPRSQLEIAVASLWASALGRETVASSENFFLLGGDSFSAVKLVSRVQEAFGVPVSLADVLDQASTVIGMARHIEELRTRAGEAVGQGTGAPGPVFRIPRRDPSLPCPMSFQQRRLWFIDRMYPGSTAYNIDLAIRITGRVDVSALERAINGVVARHEALRTTFNLGDTEPRQVVAPSLEIPLPVVDRRGLPRTEAETEVRRLLNAEVARPFSLNQGPLLRALLVALPDDEHTLLLVQHHMVTDAWSRGVFYRDLVALYDAFEKGKKSPLRPLEIQYADYAAWQRQTLTAARLQSLLGYWRSRLAGAPQAVPLPTDHPRSGQNEFSGSRMDRVLPPNLARGFFELARKERTSPYVAVLALFSAFLSRCSGSEDIVVGVPAQGRDRAETLDVIGFFLNMLPMRTDLSGAPGFRELLGRVSRTTAADLAHQDLPFERLVEDLHPNRRVGETPLFNTMCMRLDRSSRVARPRWRQDLDDFDRGTAAVDLILALNEIDDGAQRMTLRFNNAIFERATIARWMSQLERLMEGVVADPDRRLMEIPLLTEAEQHQLSVAWNDTAADYPSERCVHQLFEAQVTRTPRAVAAVCGDRQLTYAELNARANQLAHHLIALGVGAGTLVGLCLDRSLEMIVGVLGVLKAGAAYVPLDPSYPPSLIRFMLEDTGAPVLVTQQTLLSQLPPIAGHQVCLDADAAVIASQPQTDLPPRTTAERFAYIIYTSGSTGTPKGVVIPHRAVVNLLVSMARTPGLAAGDVLVAVTTLSFDIAVLELHLPLAVGATVVIAPRDCARDGHALAALLERSRATVLQGTPATWRLLLDAGWRRTVLSKALVGGEPMTRDLATRLIESGVELWNLYGPTETTVYSTFARITDPSEVMTIGRPIANTRVWIVDAHGRICPVGVAGELLLGGDGLALGYWNRPDLTAERFVPNPFSTIPGERVYRTGDRARYLADGRIEFLGRLDDQVKIRGFRIEPGEIESVLQKHSAVRQAVVLPREDSPGDTRLVAYVVPADPERPNVEALRTLMRERLPEYMRPSAYVVLDRLPLTPAGKLDRKSLKAPEYDRRASDSYVAPRNGLEEVIADIWREVLGVERIGVHDNFFESGGHSLLATQVVARLSRLLRVELPVRRMFESPTIAELARTLMNLDGELTESTLERILLEMEALPDGRPA